MKFKDSLFLLLWFAVGGICANASALAAAPEVAKGTLNLGAFVANLAKGHAAPLAKALKLESNKLMVISDEFCTKNSNAKINSLKEQFLSTHYAWNELSHLSFGPLSEI